MGLVDLLKQKGYTSYEEALKEGPESLIEGGYASGSGSSGSSDGESYYSTKTGYKSKSGTSDEDITFIENVISGQTPYEQQLIENAPEETPKYYPSETPSEPTPSPQQVVEEQEKQEFLENILEGQTPYEQKLIDQAPEETPKYYPSPAPVPTPGPSPVVSPVVVKAVETGQTPYQQQLVSQAPQKQVSPMVKTSVETGLTPYEQQLVSQAPSGTVFHPIQSPEYEYIKSKTTPEDRQQMQKYENMKPIGPEYLGFKPNPLWQRQRELQNKAVQRGYQNMSDSDKIQYTKQYATFSVNGQEKTWDEIKRDEPAAYLVVRNGQVIVEVNPERWYTELYEGADPNLGVIRQFTSGIMRSFDPMFWIRAYEGRTKEYMAEWEYQQRQNYGIGTGDVDIGGFYTGEVLLGPAYTNIVYPALIGGGITKAMQIGGSIASKSVGTVTSTLSKLGKVIDPVIKYGVIPGTVGTDIGYTFAMEHKGELPEDSGLAKLMQYGMMFGSGYAGYKTVADWKPTVGVVQEGDTVYFRKYLTTFRGKPVFGYGDIEYITGTGEIGKVVSPSPYQRGLKFENLEDVMKVQLGKTFQTPSSTSIIKYQPEGLGKIPAIGGEPSIVVHADDYTWIGTGKGWQPRTGIDIGSSDLLPSTKVYPRPVVKPSGKIVLGTDPSYTFAKNVVRPLEQGYLSDRYVSRDATWQPKKGLPKPISEIKNSEELFKLYKQDKMSTAEYQTQRDIIKKIDEVFQPKKPSTRFKPKTVRNQPILMDATKEGAISIDYYGYQQIGTGKGWQLLTGRDVGSSEFLPSTKVHPKPIVRPKYNLEEYDPLRHDLFSPLESGLTTSTEEGFFIRTKPKKIVDFGKKLRNQEKMLDDKYTRTIEGGSGYKTVQVEKGETKTKTVTRQKQKSIVDVKSIEEELSIFHPLYGQDLLIGSKMGVLQEQKQKSILHPGYRYKTTQVTRKKPLVKFDYETKSEEEQKAIVIESSISDVKQDESSIIGLLPVQDKKKAKDIISISDVVADTVMDIQGYDTITRQDQRYYYKQMYDAGFSDFLPPPVEVIVPMKGETPPVPPPPTKTPIGFLDLGEKKKRRFDPMGTLGYNVFVKKRQYRDGKRIRGAKWTKINPHPYREMDALSFGGVFVGGNEKASFRVEQTDKEPRKSRKKLPSWFDISEQFYQKDDGTYIEKNIHRIDSPGEIRNITMRGVNAPRKKHKKTVKSRTSRNNNRLFTGLDKGFENKLGRLFRL